MRGCAASLAGVRLRRVLHSLASVGLVDADRRHPLRDQVQILVQLLHHRESFHRGGGTSNGLFQLVHDLLGALKVPAIGHFLGTAHSFCGRHSKQLSGDVGIFTGHLRSVRTENRGNMLLALNEGLVHRIRVGQRHRNVGDRLKVVFVVLLRLDVAAIRRRRRRSRQFDLDEDVASFFRVEVTDVDGVSAIFATRRLVVINLDDFDSHGLGRRGHLDLGGNALRHDAHDPPERIPKRSRHVGIILDEVVSTGCGRGQVGQEIWGDY